MDDKKLTVDLVGRRFGKLTVLRFAHFKNNYPYWHCKCDCGTEKIVYQHNLLSGTTSSCGCARSSNGKKYHDKNLTYYDGVIIEKAAARTTPKNNTSGFRGVSYVKKTNKWRAKLIFKGVRYELGHYYDLEDAIKARLDAEEIIDDFLVDFYEKFDK